MNARTVHARHQLLSTALPLALASILVTAGCGSGKASTGGNAKPVGDSKSVIRGVLANTSDPLWTTIGCGATKEAKARNIDFKWYAAKTADSTELNSVFNAANLDNPQGLILDSPTGDQFIAQIQTLQKKGVPVTTTVQGMNPAPYAPIVAHQEAPPEIVAMANDVLKGGGSVFTVGGSAAVPAVADRYKGLLKELAGEPGVKVLPVQYTDFDPTKTQTAVNSAILANPNLKLIIASTGPEGQGAVAALKQSGRSDIKIIAFDAVPAEVQALRDGTILALAAQPAEEIGKIEIDVLADYLANHPGSSTPITEVKNTDVGLKLLTKQNIDDPAVQGFVYKTTCTG